MMKTRTLFAGALIAGLATVGTGGAAFAQPTQPATPAPTRAHHDKFCDTWVPRLPGLDANIDRDNHQIDALNQAIEVARAILLRDPDVAVLLADPAVSAELLDDLADRLVLTGQPASASGS
jgi:hypothetical protein